MSALDSKPLIEQTPYYYDRWTGSAAQLVRAGVIEEHQLPGRPGRPKTRARYRPDGCMIEPGRNARALMLESGAKKIHRLGTTRFEILVTVNEAEQRARSERRRLARLTDSAPPKACITLASIAASPGEYRRRNLQLAQACLQALRAGIVGPMAGGFALEPLEAFDDAASALLHTVQALSVTYDPMAHLRALAQIGAKDDLVQTLAKKANAPGVHMLRPVSARSARGVDAS
jgi:hypothetical protein